MRACARVEVIVFVVVVSTKIAKYRKLGLDRVLYVTKWLKATKNYPIFASNCLEQPTNRAFSLATPIDHTYQYHVLVLFPLCMLSLK